MSAKSRRPPGGRAPLRLPLGDDSVTTILEHLDGVCEEVLTWEKRTRATAFDA
ncbi:hypothetical protein [Streptomyces ossamyceticus]|uniref:hypothetical protein n=1 Tax=Streptomyces ossamyceticus TaxID=249581 RepID=UPI0039C9502F